MMFFDFTSKMKIKQADFVLALNDQVTRLKSTVDLLNQFTELLDLNSSELVEQGIEQAFHYDLTEPNYLYVIRTDLTDPSKLRGLYSTFKKKNKETHKLSSVNSVSEKPFEGVLYVGSSASLNTRIKQHLGQTGKKVYSLQLKEWKPDKLEKVWINIIPITDQFTDALYHLENALWDHYQPIFGKKGPNVNSSHKQ